jgi:adenylate cyclase
MEQDWDYFTESFSQLVVGWGNPGARAMAARFREITTRDELRLLFDALRELDLTAIYPEVRAKTLIEHRTDYFFPRSYTRRIASLIADCRMEIYEGEGNAFIHDFSIARDFLDDGAVEAEATGFQTLLITDLDSSTALTQRLGDEGAQLLLERHDATVREALRQHGGREVKHTGDGIMATFGSPVAALEAGLQVRRELAEQEIGVHVGLNSGEPVARDGDLFGTAVQLAFRIADQAQPGQVLVSNVVRELCAGKRFSFRPLEG